jgi:uridine phosphorylase
VASIHIRPTAQLAERALLPGDPGRALALAQALLAQPKMFNHNRGLWGYTGEAEDGGLLTIQSTGMGGPSAAIVLAELAELGLRRAIRVGTCGALDDRLGLGELIVAQASIAGDGTSRALGAGERIDASGELTAALRTAAPRAACGLIASTDLFYGRDGPDPAWEAALAVEMEAAALFALGARLGVAVGCALIVSDVWVEGERRRIDDDALLEAAERLGRVGVAALSARPSGLR